MLPGPTTHRPATFRRPPPRLDSIPPPVGPPPAWRTVAALRPAEVGRSPDLFRAVVKRQAVQRLRMRGGWTAASTILQGLAVVLLATVSARLVQTERPVVVPVKIVRTLERPAPPPPPPAAAPARPQPTPRPAPVTAPARRPPATLVQPRVVPTELKAPDPNEPIEEPWEGVEGGVVGGVVGPVEPAKAAVGVAVASAPPPAPEKPVKYRAEMTAPVFVTGPPLEYTQAALEREVEGTMVVECIVDVVGAVHGCQVLRGLPFMDRAVIATLEQRRYRPATLDGKPLGVRYTFTLKFKLP